ncbi:MAG TPA: ISKra4 family transposase [Thermomicrobiales bacterium]|nr:ISKra4 family transposase [Thermomicrobiales bacterium]
MTTNAEAIVAQISEEFQGLVASVTGPDAGQATAHPVELTLFRRLLALGGLLLRVFFLTRATARPAAPLPSGAGRPWRYHDRRPVTYYSVFGKLRFARHHFTAAGRGGVCPLDAALSLPPRCYSDLLREWLSYVSTDGSFRDSQTAVARVLGQTVSVQAIETATADDAQDVAAFYTQPPLPLVAPAATILVVQADGKGVPQVPAPDARPAPARLGKGQKRTTTKEAVVTSLYRIAPYPRTPDAVVAALLRERDDRAAAPRPTPVRKEVRATLAGKAAALTALAARAAQYDDPTAIRHRVALTDGAEALQQQMQAQFPAYTLVLDIIHAAEYLWEAANALLGERHPQRTPWVRGQLRALLAGQTATVIGAVQQAADTPTCTADQRAVLRRVAGYYRRNAPYMRYHAYLAQGWPIGTGVVEGACGHLVKARLDQSGMRWTLNGAQAVLDLRAVRLNGDWDAYWAFHRQRQHQRLYGVTQPCPAPVEQQVAVWAA